LILRYKAGAADKAPAAVQSKNPSGIDEIREHELVKTLICAYIDHRHSSTQEPPQKLTAILVRFEIPSPITARKIKESGLAKLYSCWVNFRSGKAG
jgi:hypothetical protein